MSIKRVAASGVRWMAMAQAVTTLLQLAQTVVLARLLAPEDFGLMAMVLVVVGFAHAYADMGLSNALIFRQDTTRQQLSSLYWLNLAAGLVVFAGVLLAAPFAALAFNEPRLEDLMRLAAFVFLLVPPGQQFQILLQKHLRFRNLALAETAAALLGAVVAVAAALEGYGAWALLVGYLATAGSKTMLLMRLGWREWRPGLRFSARDLRGYLGFGLYQMGERSLNFFSTRWDQMLIGSMLGAQALGYYLLAHLLVMQPIQKLNPVVMRVAFPMFARVQADTEALKAGYLMMLRVLTSVTFPILIGLGAIAPWLVPLVFGEQWHPAVPLVQILAAAGLLRAAGNPVSTLMLARGRADLTFKWNVVVALALLPALAAGAWLGGTVGVAWAVLAVSLVAAVGSYRFLVRSQLGPCLGGFLRSLAPPFVISCIMAANVLLLTAAGGVPSVLSLGLIVAEAGVVYAGLYYLLQREQFLEFRDLVLGP
ncbi:MAG: MOP flippase family protein [Alphaproteobacteria bacterium]